MGGNVELWRSSNMGGCNVNGFSGCFCKKPSEYVHVPDQTCEDHGYETITTEEDCKAAGSLLKKGQWTNFFNRLSYRGNDRPTGCSFHRFGNVELWRSSNMGDCNVNGFSGCFCKKPSNDFTPPNPEWCISGEDFNYREPMLTLAHANMDCNTAKQQCVICLREDNSWTHNRCVNSMEEITCKGVLSNLQLGQGIGRYHLTRGVRIYDGVEISTHSASVHACKMMCDTNSECKAFNYFKYSKKCTLVKSYLFFQIRSWWKSDLYRKSGL